MVYYLCFICSRRYAKALVQEMNVKVDKGFLISMAGLFRQQKELLEEVLCQSPFDLPGKKYI